MHVERDRAIHPTQFIDLDDPFTAQAILRYIIVRADIVGEDRAGRPVLRFELAAEPWLLDKLACFDARQEDTKHEPDIDHVPPIESVA